MKNILLNGDCISLMQKIPEKSIDLILCDLPYGQTQNKWDKPLELEMLWKEYNRISKPTTPILLFATMKFAAELIVSNKKYFRYDLIWEKNKSSGHLNVKRMPLRKHEHVLVFYKKAPTYNPQKTTGHKPTNAYYTSHSGKNYGQSKTMSGGGSTERFPTSILTFPIINNDDPEKIHPTQKPISLCRWLVKTYSNPGDIILDNCMGSGSAIKAAILENRNFVGIEKDQTMFEKACKQIMNVSSDSKYHIASGTSGENLETILC